VLAVLVAIAGTINLSAGFGAVERASILQLVLGALANTPAYQLEISAFGYNSGDPAIERIYPWEGFRIGVIGTP
jgi:hypothetical protein